MKKLKDKGYPIIKVSVIKHAVNSDLYATNSRAPIIEHWTGLKGGTGYMVTVGN